jgi:hypothetical protein
MNFFRSEEHVARFNESRGLTPGTTIASPEMCELAQEWWATRLAPDWRPRTTAKSQAILDRTGLNGEFWRLR